MSTDRVEDVFNIPGQNPEQPATVSVAEMQVALGNLIHEFEVRQFAFQGAITVSSEDSSVVDIINNAKKIEAYLKEG